MQSVTSQYTREDLAKDIVNIVDKYGNQIRADYERYANQLVTMAFLLVLGGVIMTLIGYHLSMTSIFSQALRWFLFLMTAVYILIGVVYFRMSVSIRKTANKSDNEIVEWLVQSLPDQDKPDTSFVGIRGNELILEAKAKMRSHKVKATIKKIKLSVIHEKSSKYPGEFLNLYVGTSRLADRKFGLRSVPLLYTERVDKPFPLGKE